MSDSDFMLQVLQERPGVWVSQMEIVRRSEQARGCGMTVHSRASDLRNRGLVVENRIERNEHGRAVSFYRLVPLSEGGDLAGPSGSDAATPSAIGNDAGTPPSLSGAGNSGDDGATPVPLFDLAPAPKGAYAGGAA